MAHWIPADRVHLLPLADAASPARRSRSPARAASVSSDGKGEGDGDGDGLNLAGGGRAASSSSTTFYLTDASGALVGAGRGEWRKYQASKPTGAATKAFRVFVRSATGKRALATLRARDRASEGDEGDKGDEGDEGDYMPATVEAALEAGMAKGALSAAEAATYRAGYWVDDPALFKLRVDVYIVRKGKASVRRYQVAYARLLKPNVHEIRKGINKVAKATYVPKGRTLPRGVANAADMEVEADATPDTRPARSAKRARR